MESFFASLKKELVHGADFAIIQACMLAQSLPEITATARLVGLWRLGQSHLHELAHQTVDCSAGLTAENCVFSHPAIIIALRRTVYIVLSLWCYHLLRGVVGILCRRGKKSVAGNRHTWDFPCSDTTSCYYPHCPAVLGREVMGDTSGWRRGFLFNPATPDGQPLSRRNPESGQMTGRRCAPHPAARTRPHRRR